MIGKSRTPLIYLALGIMQAAHSTEEYLTRLYDWFPVVTGYAHNAIGFFPVVKMNDQTFVVLNIVVITLLLSVSPFIFQNKTWAFKVAKVIAVIEILNGFAHVSGAIYVWDYYPGSISAIGLLVMGTLLARNLFKNSKPRASNSE